MTTPAGWYPDPYDASQLRYWDGAVWTESTSPAGAPAAAGPEQPPGGGYQQTPSYGQTPAYTPPSYGDAPPGYGGADAWTQRAATPGGGGLGDIGDWLSGTFSRLLERIAPIAVLLYVIPAIVAILIALYARSFIGDIVIDNVANEVRGFSGAKLFALFGLTLLSLIVGGWSALAANHQMYTAHDGRPASLGASAATGLRRLPRAIGWGIVLALAALALYIAFVVLIAVIIAAGASGDDFSPLAALALVPVAIVGFLLVIWLWVKLAFFGVALAVGPAGTNPISTSWGLARGRWWGLFGRLILVALAGIAIWIAFNVVSNVVFGTLFADLFQVDATTGELLIDGQPIDERDEIALVDFLPGPGAFALLSAISTLTAAVVQALWISAITGLYRRLGAPAEH